ncbi:MAG: hypothetical protein K2H45_08460 [Acetatifactor sp.]|nr:hypothetical protein [Acetatifactor sp.]
MDVEEAKELLSFHSGRNSDFHNPKWTNGFLGSLRPIQGLNRENFIEVIECLRTLKDEIVSPLIDREIVSDIVGITHLTRIWASPQGMLGRNHLLTEEQTKHLLAWVNIIEDCFMYLLEDAEEEAFVDFELYLKGEYF